MLKRIRLTDFKSFVDEEVELAPLTLLVGANASGKSNLLDAIRFLHGISSDLTIAEVLNGEERSRPDAWLGIRGRAQDARPAQGRARHSLDRGAVGEKSQGALRRSLPRCQRSKARCRRRAGVGYAGARARLARSPSGLP
ncbi:MAG TPA: AAA family ATPase [Thermoanaerobaculia bacterium]|nr:AAA family ATPase [Thermoanaerobaculia bacterium]